MVLLTKNHNMKSNLQDFNSRFRIVIFLLIFSLVLSCSSNDSGSDSSSETVFVVGYEQGPKKVAKLWKNGVATDLTDGTINAYANSVL